MPSPGCPSRRRSAAPRKPWHRAVAKGEPVSLSPLLPSEPPAMVSIARSSAAAEVSTCQAGWRR